MTTFCILINVIASFSFQDNVFYAIRPIEVDKFVTEKTSISLRIDAVI
ncbi:hypothetical protein FDUTEX481_05076 [Tolypothrix sp. PCC 7601]|nr:hypothetical protein FDUTEX481_05076 [Tolypothrix sp. PCC 7601]